jgi:hypothetical protein
MTRAQYAQLRALADTPGQACTLSYLGSTYQVIWRHQDPPALDATDVIDYADPTAAEMVLPTKTHGDFLMQRLRHQLYEAEVPLDVPEGGGADGPGDHRRAQQQLFPDIPELSRVLGE